MVTGRACNLRDYSIDRGAGAAKLAHIPCLHSSMRPPRVNMFVLLLFCADLAHTGNGFPDVSLTVCPAEGHESNTLQYDLELNWQPSLDADWICLYNVSSLQEVTQDTEPLIRISPHDYPDGYYSTNISFAEQQYPNGWSKGSGENPVPGDACLSYWIAAYKYNELHQAVCLKIHPTWMWDHRAELENMPLIGLFFPGTYNSNHFNRGSIPLPRQTVSHFLLTQDSDVWGELIRGIRYLDVDIEYCPNQGSSSTPAITDDDRCSVNHSLPHANHLLPVLKDIKEFLKRAKYEIVILDIHHFPMGFEKNTDLHREFVSLLYSELGDYILSFDNITYNSTLADVWHTGRTLIVAYNDSETTTEFAWLWGPIPRLYGDHQTTEGLKTFLWQCMDDARATSGTTLEMSTTSNLPTPAVSTSDNSDSLHDLIDMASRNITKWFHNYWWRYSNLVATDFFLGNNITDVNVRACLDKANNVIFQIASED
ncbi:PI-PLC X domain-containing protein 1-like [Schistocerca serialis cubense]|uniref:PI-PLC X domain-containing protein 1-like n=2 Tax=Schistocerca TaxID=7008 RepID=UPI00214EBBC6|nr:PI-PLC X domain-containing protein 1-like [Schistocerca serialis cubense]